MLSPSQEIIPMPTESLLVTVCVVAMFVVFGAVLAWDQTRTRTEQLARQGDDKRRAF
jgi:hypothetical protein